ncbi:uncharacterized protein SCODWIG_03225 [Saccharomycodes ludwigii]|uniref:Uncharacterized protein n=1 Tax=Saccharomycodes ludwigii TaxID=36035 RepID=A0A376BA96_9ASCO|nr:hypothetical protein SCDLUD_004313 [Saccharomycodes ludwigii]KAH3899996.1 hypothetical protein SCDLUD_004313 [Saccharomycodes ludwigii]SSD61464.1 uncharacterized protein SCODWIG_03225 [Saccharomycodes ludwigii]
MHLRSNKNVMNIDTLTYYLLYIPIFKYYGIITIALNLGIILIYGIDFHFNLSIIISILVISITQAIIKVNQWCKKNNGGKNEWIPLSKRENVSINVVVTGGGNGLGLKIVESLISRYSNNKTISNLNNLKMSIIVIDKEIPVGITSTKNLSVEVHYIKHDFKNAPNQNLYKKILEKFDNSNSNSINVLINNAAIRYKFDELYNIEDDIIRENFQVNVFSPVSLIKMLKPNYLITISSVLGLIAPSNCSVYAATKSALLSFHDSWIHERRERRGLLVLPGQLKDTDMFRNITPPKPFFAPLVDINQLVNEILLKLEIGECGELCMPLYVNFMSILRCLPYFMVEILRKFSGVDDCKEENF